MAYRKNTIRKLAGPESRKVARLINNLESSLTKLKNLLPSIESIEIDSIALYNRLSTYEKQVFDQEKTLATEALIHKNIEVPHTDGSDPEIDGPLFHEPIAEALIDKNIEVPHTDRSDPERDLEMAQHKDQQAMQDKGMME